MNVTFRVDSSSKIGLGHIMRCMALADELKRNGCRITFICRSLEGNIIDSIQHKVVVLPNNNFQSDENSLRYLDLFQKQDATETISSLPLNTDLLVVDSYLLNMEWHQELRNYTKKIMVIDDLADRNFDCDLLLNQNLGFQEKDYRGKVPNNCKLLLGSNYALLRSEFSEKRKQALIKRQYTSKVKNILVSVGGSDINNVTYDILQELDYRFNVVVVLGKASPHNELIKHYAKDKNIKVIINANNMAELMLDADLAIGAGGSTSWERCCLGLPTLLYVLAENQMAISESLEDIGAVKIIRNLQQDLQSFIDKPDLLTNISINAKSACDGLGSTRVGEYVK